VAEIETEKKPQQSPTVPSTGIFWMLLITLWALNFADTMQTLYLNETGFLAQEANLFMDFFLKEGRLSLFGAKILALLLVSLILGRGWFDLNGITMQGRRYTQDQVRRAISFLLSAGVIYYILIVVFPFIAMFISGFFTA
jgi:hypothetical protein